MKKILQSVFSITFKSCKFACIPFFLLLLFSCKGGLEETEYQKNREANALQEKVFRLDKDRFLDVPMPLAQAPNRYPWETDQQLNLSLITKEFFRCKGDSSHESYALESEERIFDCTGSSRHSLPLHDEKEFIYPILIDLLNDLQKNLQSKVIITCGHRCPQHNRYSEPSEANRTSKHMVGGEVDFYVEGFEKKPELIVDLLKDYYLYDPKTQNDPAYTTFKRYTKADSHVATHPWYNSEIYIKIYRENEGRDFDNQHSNPYISIQVRVDRNKKKRVTYTWEQAFYSYLRY